MAYKREGIYIDKQDHLTELCTEGQGIFIFSIQDPIKILYFLKVLKHLKIREMAQ